MTLRKKLIRLAHENPELRKDLLPLLKTAAQLDVHGQADDIVRKGWAATEKKLVVLKGKAARAMKPHKFILDERKSYLEAGGGGSDGVMAEGELFFTDEGDTLRTETESQDIFEKVLGAWPSRRNDVWSVYFGK